MTLSSALRTALALLASGIFGNAAVAQDGPRKLPAVKLTAGMHVMQVEVAQTPEQRSIGLMFRKSMPTNDGMLFIFERPGQQCFWMKNTLLPLAIAFIGDDGSIANIEEMKPQTLDSHCSAKEVRYVLEMNEGWFAKRGIKAGMKVQGGPFKR
ncbi:MAG: DUF192 domain-containing protein [Rhizobiales bacterium]|nr:DUF192 domain-containing protein [Rhizobacter sp.]